MRHLNFFKVEKGLLGLVLVFYILLRVYQLEERTPFGWDQVYNAWGAKNIIINREYPLVGMQAKLNSGMYIGPFYSYLNAFAFYITRLDPIAEPLLSTLISFVTFFIVWFVAKEIFSRQVAFITIIFYTFSFYIIYLDRVPWPVNLITPFSALVFYSLYKLLRGKYKFFLLLAFSLGGLFNAHFTAVLVLPIIFISFLKMPKEKSMIKYIFVSFPIFLIWIFPVILFQIKTGSHTFFQFYNGNSHGFHLRRFFQVAKDAVIEFSGIFDSFPVMKNFQFIFFPFFIFLYLRQNKSKENVDLIILMGLWLLVPWIAFSLYNGEISNYYFTITRPVIIMVLAYIFVYIFTLKHWFFKSFTVTFLSVFILLNLRTFFNFRVPENLLHYKKDMEEKIRRGKKVEFVEGIPESYLYYISKQCDFCKKSEI